MFLFSRNRIIYSKHGSIKLHQLEMALIKLHLLITLLLTNLDLN